MSQMTETYRRFYHKVFTKPSEKPVFTRLVHKDAGASSGNDNFHPTISGEASHDPRFVICHIKVVDVQLQHSLQPFRTIADCQRRPRTRFCFATVRVARQCHEALSLRNVLPPLTCENKKHA